MSRATTLGDMVIQQYDIYATQNYALLNAYNVTLQSPKVFFNKPDNFGFDGLDITTIANFGQNQSSCTITATIGWQEGGNRKTAQFVKVYTQTSSQSSFGGLVQVSVVPSCGGYTAISDIQANCPGAPNMTVSAINASGAPVTATTGTDGSAILSGVMISSAVTIQVTAPTPSGVGVSSGSPNFVQGYGVWNPVTSSYNLTASTTIAVVSSVVNKAVVVQFQAAGQVTGVLTNASDAGVVSGMKVRVGGGALVGGATNGGFQSCNYLWDNGCTVLTSSSPVPGQFTFYNVLPGALSLYADGSPGSNPNVQQTDPAFTWAYTDPQALPFPANSWSNAAVPVLTAPGLSVQRLGWLVVQTSPLTAGATVWTNNLTNQFSWYGGGQTFSEITDASGAVYLYNCVFSNSPTQPYNFSGSRGPQPPTDNGWYGQVNNWTCGGSCLGVANTVNLILTQGYTLTGQFLDSYMPTVSTRTANMTFTVVNQSYEGTTSVLTTAGGVFTLYGLTPATFTNLPPGTPFTITGSLTSNTIPINVTLSGTVTDTNGVPAGSPAPHAAFQVRSLNAGNNYTFTTVTADANGNISWNGYVPYSTNVTFSVVCPGSSLNCTMSPGPGTPIDTALESVTWQNASTYGWNVSSGTAQVADGQTTTLSLTATLLSFPVQGTVTQAGTGQPIADLQVYDGNNSASWAHTPTISNGTYSGYFIVAGRQGGSAGSVSVYIPSQLDYQTTYQAASPQTLTVPNPPDPQAPITGINFSMQVGSGSGSQGSSGSGSSM
jgi:hypothetical protein